MDLKTKQVLSEALFIYDWTPTAERPALIAKVERNLSVHYWAYDALPFAASREYVNAGLIFYRIIKGRHYVDRPLPF